MANTLLPLAERNMTPDEVVALDKRREWGLTLQVIAGQFSVIFVLLCLWVGQDLTYSPGWAHPMAYYMAIAIGIIVVCGGTGTFMRRGVSPID
jgi:nitrate reductase gamma subunit